MMYVLHTAKISHYGNAKISLYSVCHEYAWDNEKL